MVGQAAGILMHIEGLLIGPSTCFVAAIKSVRSKESTDFVGPTNSQLRILKISLSFLNYSQIIPLGFPIQVPIMSSINRRKRGRYLP